MFAPVRISNHEGADTIRILSAEARLLTFRMTRQGFLDLDGRHLLFGLACTWIVGMGRYWDDPGAMLAQHLGLGSVIYIFLLSLLLWLVIWPLRPINWSYGKVLAFVSLTSVPAIFYAIPVERFLSLETARSVNAWFLAVVAAWRVGLLIVFLKRYAQLEILQLIVVTLLPLTLIITTLTALNLERAVFDLMGGLREGGGTSNDTAYMVLNILTFCSVLLFIPLLACYVAAVVNSYSKRKASRLAKEQTFQVN